MQPPPMPRLLLPPLFNLTAQFDAPEQLPLAGLSAMLQEAGGPVMVPLCFRSGLERELLWGWLTLPTATPSPGCD